MTIKAVLIGGDFDLATIFVNSELTNIYMHKPVHAYSDGFPKDIENVPVKCFELRYRLSYKTRKGVLIYEFDENKDPRF